MEIREAKLRFLINHTIFQCGKGNIPAIRSWYCGDSMAKLTQENYICGNKM